MTKHTSHESLIAPRLRVSVLQSHEIELIHELALNVLAETGIIIHYPPALDLLRAMRALGVPRILVATVSFMYRYLFVIAEEAQRLLRARDSRSAGLEGHRCGGSVRWRGRVLGHMVGSLFLRSYERSERVYAAMQARGYDGEVRFLRDNAWRLAEIVVAAALVLYVVGVQVYARY